MRWVGWVVGTMGKERSCDCARGRGHDRKARVYEI